ncbi:MIP/aquaporin family protein [Ilyobacter sp.]|jgi:glycerol uptake facilitator protein|uniref:MIP/aquaporin family protein n=1 Tax=Ilyobacter sp. TaxID=3100343 RepID=UPI00356AD5D3
MKRENLFGECIAEYLGTGLLIFFGAGCVSSLVLSGAQMGLWEISIVWGFGVAMAIYITGGVSGAHINPAVTIALATFKGFDKKKVIPYIISQILGAFSASGLVYFLYRNLFIAFESNNGIVRGSVESLATAGIFSTYPNPAINNMQAFVVEIVITAVLMITILAVTDDKNGAPKGHMSALLIGIVIAVIGGSFGTLTGFAMNPARDFGPKLFAFVAGWGNVAFTGGLSNPYFWVPILGPICGTLGGTVIYDKLILANIPSENEEEANELAVD